MRGGLTEAGPTPAQAGPTAARGTFQAAITAVTVLAALALFVSACATGGTGTRDEGPAHADAVAGAATMTPSAAPTRIPSRVDAVQLVKADPEVSAEVKGELKPCVGDEYPVDVSYGDLTGGPVTDIVVNVLTCGDAVGVGSYVYREKDGRYENVFRTEEPPVYAEIDRGDLVVTKQVYAKGDSVSNPSGENVITYRWTSAEHFVKEFTIHNEYSSIVDGDPTPVPGTG
ncbi:hypothetical protein [Streptomyces griseoruber]|uniref:Lipoprotein CseA n=1 Tax=Streptomyces griseoruber TaxID=1943 RepID=A0A101SRH4_9ACTN|nr:hypothetical protein [Streptomyces griseoruber]KUN78805.1 hypothetical protein AQJ64_30360 [Streptomyces griseoruber]